MDPRDQTVQKKYFVLDDDPEAGLGNRFQVIVSAFLFSLLSKRALLINWPKVEPMLHWNKEESVAMPSLEELLESPGFDWDFSHYRDLIPALHCDKTREYKIEEETLFSCCTFEDKDQKDMKCHNISRYRGVHNLFQCSYFDVEPEQEEVMWFKHWDYFAPTLALNPYYAVELKRLFSSGNFFTPLARFLLRPLKPIQDTIDDFKRKHFGDYTLGLQIRRVGINKLNDSQEDLFWQTALFITQQKSFAFNNIKWYLATDSVRTRERATREFGTYVIFNNGTIGRNSTDTVVNGLIDMWLLSECDDIIASAASTFGKVAFGLLGKPPLIVNRNSEIFLKKDWQPCFFFFQKHWCFQQELMTVELTSQMTDCWFT